jgi:hypothetical protein
MGRQNKDLEKLKGGGESCRAGGRGPAAVAGPSQVGGRPRSLCFQRLRLRRRRVVDVGYRRPSVVGVRLLLLVLQQHASACEHGIWLLQPRAMAVLPRSLPSLVVCAIARVLPAPNPKRS